MSKMGSTCLLPFGAGAFAFDGFLALFAFLIDSIPRFAARRFSILSQLRMSRKCCLSISAIPNGCPVTT